MKSQLQPEVAVLLATYNGARYLEPQIQSLRDNKTRFTLHWLDDCSTDSTREVVRAAASRFEIELREWHLPEHRGYPGGFFHLLECVEADLYMFCDQDDVWQPGKIDTTVASLLPSLTSPALCFSDPLMFNDDQPNILHRVSEVIGDAKRPEAQDESKLFTAFQAVGHTQGFTRPLREIFLKHKEIAQSYAFAHDWWMYQIAVASGTVKMLSDVPTTLYRRHAENFTSFIVSPHGNRIAWMWRLQQWLRRAVSRHATGFVLAASTLPPGPKLERLLAIAKMVSTLDRRQSPAALFRLARSGAMWPSRRTALWFTAACLSSNTNS